MTSQHSTAREHHKLSVDFVTTNACVAPASRWSFIKLYTHNECWYLLGETLLGISGDLLMFNRLSYVQILLICWVLFRQNFKPFIITLEVKIKNLKLCLRPIVAFALKLCQSFDNSLSKDFYTEVSADINSYRRKIALCVSARFDLYFNCY